MIDFPRENFNDVTSGIVSVFILIFAEDWNSIMDLYSRAFVKIGKSSWVP